MHEFTHTPGPWVVSHGGLPGDDGFSIATNNAAAERVKIVCESWPCTIGDSYHREELRSNARLITSAPDLLKTLLWIADLIASEHPSDWASETIAEIESRIKNNLSAAIPERA